MDNIQNVHLSGAPDSTDGSVDSPTDHIPLNAEGINKESDLSEPQSKKTIMKNVIVVSLAFLLLFSSYLSLQNLQSSLNKDENLGLISLIIIYSSLILSSMFLPPVLIGQLGCKWTLVISMVCYSAFTAANYYPRWYTLGFTSVLLGLGAAPLWSSKCAYLTTTAIAFSKTNNKDQDAVITRFFGIFFMIFNSAHVWGNVISSSVLERSAKHSSNSTQTDVSDICGSHDCGKGLELAQNGSDVLIVPEHSTVVMLVSIYLACSILSILVIVFLLDQLHDEDKKEKVPIFHLFFATLYNLKDVRLILIIPLTIYSGLQQGFLFVDFTKSFVTCVFGIDKVGYVMICFGVCDSLFAYILGKLTKYIGRIPIFVSGAVIHLAVYIALLSWKANRDQLWVTFLVAALCGYADAVWQTQINALYGILFHEKQEAAFSNYRLWNSLGYVISFALSSVLCVSVQIYIIMAVLIIAMALYSIVEFNHRKSSESFNTQQRLT